MNVVDIYIYVGLPTPTDCFFGGNLSSSLIKQHHYNRLAGKAARSQGLLNPN